MIKRRARGPIVHDNRIAPSAVVIPAHSTTDVSQAAACHAGAACRSRTLVGEIDSSSRLPVRGLVAGRGLHVEGMHLGLVVHQVLNHLADFGVVLAPVPFGIFFRLPETLSEDAFNVDNTFSCSMLQTSLAFSGFVFTSTTRTNI